jgi:uncharacterized protein
MDPSLLELVWRGVTAANPWWESGEVPPQRTATYRRAAFEVVHAALVSADVGRGVVLLGPRRVGKTVLLHQVAEQLLADGVPQRRICLLSLDDVALRGLDLGALIELLEARCPLPPTAHRTLLLDEVQHSPDWAGWLKRLTDRRDPIVFLATGSSATALSHGGQDAGLGRWREMTLYPWSFREHVQLRKLPGSFFAPLDEALRAHRTQQGIGDDVALVLGAIKPPLPADEIERLEAAFLDYLLRGGFPEAAMADDLQEARRRLRQDILDRALGRDVVDVVGADPRVLERLFLRVCLHPGGLWNETEVAGDLGISRPTVSRYLGILERAFLLFRLPNLASPVKGQPKVYLVAPALRQALLGMDESQITLPQEWGQMAENAVAAAVVGTRPSAMQVGFWRRGNAECDVVVIRPGGTSEYLEVKRSSRKGRQAERGIQRALEGLGHPGRGFTLVRGAPRTKDQIQLALWLYTQDASAGGTLRVALG